MRPNDEPPKTNGYIKPVPPKKPSVPVVRRVVNEKVINKSEIALGR
jgi:hypothetical protein